MIKEDGIRNYIRFTQYVAMVLIRDMEDAVEKIKKTENSDEVFDIEKCYENKGKLQGDLYILRTCIKIETMFFEGNRGINKEKLIIALSDFTIHNLVIDGEYRKI